MPAFTSSPPGGTPVSITVTPRASQASSITEESSQAEMRMHFIKDLRAAHKFRRDAANELWVYSGGRYVPASAEWTLDRCTTLVSDLYHGHIVPSMIDAVHMHLKARQPLLEPTPPKSLVNLRNGIWDAKAARLLPHSPSLWPSPVQIPVDYNPDAKCPKIDKFFSMIFPDDSQDFVDELYGSFLVSNTFYQQILWLTGPGGNGKGTQIKLAAAFLGKENCAPIRLSELSTDRFATADIYGKLLIYDGDTPIERMLHVDVLKRITGGDTIRAQHKGLRAFSFDPFCTVMIGANDQPDAVDFSQGMLDRPMIIPCTRRIRGTAGQRTDQDTYIAELLAGDGAAGLLNRALRGLDRLLKRGLILPPSVAGATNAYKAQANPIEQFFLESLQLDPNGLLKLKDIRPLFIDWARGNGRSVKATNDNIAEWICTRYPQVKRGRMDASNGTGPEVLRGVSWTVE